MGLFDKLFGGNAKQPTSTPTPAPASSDGDAPSVARRERSRPQGGPPAPAAATAPQQPYTPPVIDPSSENAALLTAIGGVIAANTPESRLELYKAILAADLYLLSMPGPDGEQVPAGEITIQEGQQLQLATIRDPQGRTFLPAFTDVDRMSASLPEGEKARYIRINAASVCRMFMQSEGEGIVVNPGQPPSGVISRAEAQVLATGNPPQIDENGQLVGEMQQMRILIGKPETPPAQAMIDAIQAEAPKHPSVREIHLFKGGIEGQPPKLMIGMYLDEGLPVEEMQPTFVAIGQAAYATRGEGDEEFDMMPLNEQLLAAVRPLEGVVYLRDQQA